MPNFIDISTQRFGRWTAVEYAGTRKWLCRCDCGVTKKVDAATLRNGHSTSCGCLRTEIVRNRVTTHGKARKGMVQSEWNIWSNMRQRCYNPKNLSFPNYGGRGITVCSQWEKSFSTFYKDMGPRPSQAHSIDRIDNNGPYSPENCKWAYQKEQCRNRRNNRLVAFNNLTLTLAEWGERTGIDSETISYRLKNGWTIERALRTPVVH